MLDRVTGKRRPMGVVEGAAIGLADRRAGGRDDDGVGHGRLLPVVPQLCRMARGGASVPPGAASTPGAGGPPREPLSRMSPNERGAGVRATAAGQKAEQAPPRRAVPHPDGSAVSTSPSGRGWLLQLQPLLA